MEISLTGANATRGIGTLPQKAKCILAAGKKLIYTQRIKLIDYKQKIVSDYRLGKAYLQMGVNF